MSASPPGGCSCDGNNGGGGVIEDPSSGCFSGDTTVYTPEGKKLMKDLQVGDKVLTGSHKDSYQTVYSFGHKAPATVGHFVKIFVTVDGNGGHKKHQPIEITGEHLLYLKDQPHPVRADAVKVGDILLGLGEGSAQITKLSTVQKEGLYAPLTAAGSIVVNGLVASTYISHQQDAPFFVQIGQGGWLELPLSQADIGHIWVTPLRMLCGASSGQMPSYCSQDDSNEFHPWVSFGMRLIRFGEQQHIFIQIALLALFVVLLLPLIVLEFTLLSMGGCLGLALLWFVVLERTMNYFAVEVIFRDLTKNMAFR